MHLVTCKLLFRPCAVMDHCDVLVPEYGLVLIIVYLFLASLWLISIDGYIVVKAINMKQACLEMVK